MSIKTKMTFEINGKTKSDIEQKAVSEIANFLDIDTYDVESKCEIELHIEPNTADGYKAIVYVRVK